MPKFINYDQRSKPVGVQGSGPALSRPGAQASFSNADRQDADLARALLRLGGTGIDAYQDYMATKVAEAGQAYQAELMAEKNRYMEKNQGESALGAGEHFDKFAKEKAQSYMDRFENNDKARHLFTRQAAGTALHFAETGEGYARQQKSAWQKSVLEGQLSSFEQMVAENYTNDELVAHKSQILKETVANMVPGMDHTSTFAEIDKKTVGNRIGAYLASGDIGSAKALFTKQGSLLGGQADEYMGRIRQEAKRLENEGKARRAEAMFDQAEGLANSYWQRVNNEEMTASQALLEMRDTITDPKMQRQAMGSFTQLNQLGRLAQEEEAIKLRAKASNDMEAAGDDVNAIWQLRQSAKKSALSENATKADKAYAKQVEAIAQARLEFADPAIRAGSKPEAYSKLLSGIADGSFTSPEALKGSEEWAWLTPQGKQTMLKSLEQGQAVVMSDATRLFREQFRDINGREYSSAKDKGLMDAAMLFVQQQVQTSNRAQEPGYVEKVLDAFFMNTSIPDSGTFWDSKGRFGELIKKGEGVPLPVLELEQLNKIAQMFTEHPEIQQAYMSKYGNLNKAIRGYELERTMRGIGPYKQGDK